MITWDCVAEGRHLEKTLSETGFGFGKLEYFCPACQKTIDSVTVAEMNPAELRHVGMLSGKAFTMTPNLRLDFKTGEPQ